MRFTTSTLAKAMLERSKNVVRVKKVHSGAVYNVFEKFASNTNQGNRSVIFNVIFVTFFEKRKDVSSFPVVRDSTSIERSLKKDCENFMKFIRTDFKEFTGDIIRASGFVFINPLKKF